MIQTYNFHVHGMHCKSCVILTESELGELPGVKSVKADLKHHRVEVNGDFGEKSPEEIAALLSVPMAKHGYTISTEKAQFKPKWREFMWAIPFALLFLVVFIVLQKIGLVNLIGAGDVTYGTAFVIGLIASVSTCMAVVGGLVLSVSANFAKEGEKFRPQIYFHAARLIGFFVLGGVIGLLGSTFKLGLGGTFALSLIVAIIMLILGINLLDIFPWFKKLQVSMPGGLGKKIHALKDLNHTLTPALLGVATFFLPCGFTQSMQIYTLTTGDFLKGGLTMLVFALGTLPVLGLLSFSSYSIHKKAQSGVFFKTAGLVVIFFGIFNLINSMVTIGLIPPVFNF